MKYLLPLFFAFFYSTCLSQTIKLPTDSGGRVLYTVKGESSNDRDVLFLASKYWVASVFKNYKEVIQLEDKDLGKIVLNGSVGGDGYKAQYYVSYRITIDCVDGKYLYTLGDIDKISTVRADRTSLSDHYSLYLQNYNLLQALKAKQALSSTTKKEQKVLAKQVFDLETNHIVLGKEISEINRKIGDIVSSYLSFMAKK